MSRLTDPNQHFNHTHLGNLPPVTDEWRVEYEARKQSARLRKGEDMAGDDFMVDWKTDA